VRDIQAGDLVLIHNLETGAATLAVAEIPPDGGVSLRFVPVVGDSESEAN
jgi:hypothetical protein